MEILCTLLGLTISLAANSSGAASGSEFPMERRINTWLVAGPFPAEPLNAIARDYLGSESAVEPAPGAAAGISTWQVMDDRLYCRNQDDYIDLFTWFLAVRPGAPQGGNEHVAAYAHVYFWSPDPFDGLLLIAPSDSATVWLNGEVVAAISPELESNLRAEHRVKIQPQAGWNRLLIKTANGKDTWGFHAKISDANGGNAEGLEYAVDKPAGELRITTRELPRGYEYWPYLWQSVKDIPPSRAVPSASPFRLSATGGAPPYTWSLVQGTLPDRLTLDEVEGEFGGYVYHGAEALELTVQVKDARGATANQPLSMEILKRPTDWFEQGKLGGLIHGTDAFDLIHGPPEEQARLMALQGFTYACPTTGYWPGSAEWPGWYSPAHDYQKEFGFHPPQPYLEAFKNAGVSYGSYLNVRDAMTYTYPEGETDFNTWPAYNDFMHRYLRQWAALARPSVIWLDGVHLPAPKSVDNCGYDFDALYSIVRTVSPETLIIANAGGNPGLDHLFGDCDVVSTEGHNDKPNDCYWDRWPKSQAGLRSKHVPHESWRYPVEGQRDWQEWSRVIVSMIAEGYVCNLDHSYTPELAAMHEQLGQWLGPRLESLRGTRPVPIPLGGEWGYVVARDKDTYLHILRNKRGKVGLQPGVTRIWVPGLIPTKSAVLIPSGEAVPFKRTGATTDLDLSGIALDPVDTIIKLTTK